MQLHPYLFFNGRCDEALAFYGKALDAEIVDLMRYKDAPAPADAGQGSSSAACPSMAGRLEKVMHATVRIGDTVLFASDGNEDGGPQFRGFGITIEAAGQAEARRFFDALADGGQVTMPLGPTFFAESFGMVADRYGVLWLIIVHAR
ncbi:VOC family protein [Candidimonas humi]|uniref:VOC family protein n=1 Tax=Candidimonas humi TaxID=683355 RepID=A0ABV8P1X0_9BURK|nr:VOC family protein [Candidimonas humi]MBV6306988.1 VOC family protein [Candidimonas humi]